MEHSPGPLREVALEVAIKVADFLRSKFGIRDFAKKAEGLGTEETLIADWEAEELAINLLERRGFRGLVIAEEHEVVELGSEDLVALIDPLDGSKNYANGIPWCSVSLAFARRPESKAPLDELLIAGAVVPIVLGSPMSFESGGGVFVGEAKYRRPKSPFPMIFAYLEEREAAAVVNRYRKLSGSKPVRSLGSAAMELSMVALGKGEVFIDARARLRVVDIAAGIGALKECGAVYSDILGNPLEVKLNELERISSVAAGFDTSYHQLILKAVEEEGLATFFENLYGAEQ